jgi:putative serine protease PepD
MKPRSALHTLGAVLIGALVTFGLAAGAVLIGLVDLSGHKTRVVETTAAPSTGVAAPSKSGGVSDSLAALYRNVSDGVVYVEASGPQGAASGSGFLVDRSGDIVTNEHVIAGANAVRVRIGEQGSPVDARIVGADPNTDIAVLKVDPGAVGSAKPLALGDSSKLQIGQSAIAIGSPFGLQGTLTTGIVSALDRQIQSPSGQAIDGAIQTDAAINPGNSGGPLLDSHGRVIGINAQIASDSGTSSGVGFAIPIETVKKIVPEIESGALGQSATEAPQPENPVIVIG